MTTQPLPSDSRADQKGPASRSTRMRRQPSLAARHARALYRPVPPVELDDDGYPFRDGAAVESDVHDEVSSYASQALRTRYGDRSDVHVGANLGLFFERGNRGAVVVPDGMVTFGVESGRRLSFKLWDEGKMPAFALELLSRHTWRIDVVVKPPLYEALGVREFWIFDPIGRLPQPFVGRRLNASGAYERVPAQPDGSWRSEVLGLDLVPLDEGFRFRDPATGECLPNLRESIQQNQRDRKARESADKARESADKARASAESARAQAEKAREEERTVRMAAEARVAELEERLRRHEA